jgi:ActR/RegA family two-component response regulator
VGVTIDSILIRDKTLPATDLDGRVVVLSVYAGAYVSFNEVASEIWHMLSEPRRVGDIFHALSQSHDVDETELSHDVLPFLQKLIERKLARLLHQDGAR